MAAKQTLSSKRGPPAPLSSSSSSSEGEGSDHEDVPPSPCSSTASGPTYERPPGFQFHGQEIVATKPRNVSTKSGAKLKKRIKRHPVENGLLRQGLNREDEITLASAASKPKTKKGRSYWFFLMGSEVNERGRGWGEGSSVIDQGGKGIATFVSHVKSVLLPKSKTWQN